MITLSRLFCDVYGTSHFFFINDFPVQIVCDLALCPLSPLSSLTLVYVVPYPIVLQIGCISFGVRDVIDILMNMVYISFLELHSFSSSSADLVICADGECHDVDVYKELIQSIVFSPFAQRSSFELLGFMMR